MKECLKSACLPDKRRCSVSFPRHYSLTACVLMFVSVPPGCCLQRHNLRTFLTCFVVVCRCGISRHLRTAALQDVVSVGT
jgi:hypothetical protein